MYEVELDADLPAEAEAAFADGRIVLDGAPCAPAELRRTGPRRAEVTLMEGKYHQVKRMFASQARSCRFVLLFGYLHLANAEPGGGWHPRSAAAW